MFIPNIVYLFVGGSRRARHIQMVFDPGIDPSSGCPHQLLVGTVQKPMSMAATGWDSLHPQSVWFPLGFPLEPTKKGHTINK